MGSKSNNHSPGVITSALHVKSYDTFNMMTQLLTVCQVVSYTSTVHGAICPRVHHVGTVKPSLLIHVCEVREDSYPQL